MSDWRSRAACLGRDPELFFPTPGDTAGQEEAKAICRTCPVINKCRHEHRAHGVWGGRYYDPDSNQQHHGAQP